MIYTTGTSILYNLDFEGDNNWEWQIKEGQYNKEIHAVLWPYFLDQRTAVDNFSW